MPVGGQSAFLGNPNIYISPDFQSGLDTLNNLALQYGVTLILNSQARSVIPQSGTVVTPATNSNHFTGDAIDVNFQVRLQVEAPS